MTKTEYDYTYSIIGLCLLGLTCIGILLFLFYPNNCNFNSYDILSPIILGLVFGSFYYLLNEVFNND